MSWFDEYDTDVTGVGGSYFGGDPNQSDAETSRLLNQQNDALWRTGYFDDVTPDYSNEGKNYPTTESTQGPGGSPVNSSIDSSGSGVDSIKKLFDTLTKDKSGNFDLGKIIPLIGGLAMASKSNQRTMPSGYQGGIPTYTATRQTPGAGQRLSGNVLFSKPDGAVVNPNSGAPATAMRGYEGLGGLAGALGGQRRTEAEIMADIARGKEYGRAMADAPVSPDAWMTTPNRSGSMRRAEPRPYDYPEANMRPVEGTAPPYAAGGELRTNGFIFPADVVSHLGNGSSDAGLKLLASKLGATPIKGAGDGMSDSIPTTIDGKEKALVAHEEAYLTPEKVARIGGGDAKKGAQKLRQMMERIREARTGTKEQGKQINPNRFMPGGMVKKYDAGGTTSATGVGSAAAAGVTGTESNLSNWAGPYVTDMLAKGKALSEMPYEQYGGPLTAGPSALQTQAFNQAANLQTPAAIGQAAQTAGDIAQKAQNLSYSPTSFTNQFTAPDAYTAGTFNTGTFGTEQAQQYMNPYLESALAPQLAELQRQNKIANLADMAKVTRAGALGGGRQALMQTENTRNLMDKINQVTGQGYSTAYDKAMAQFNADQQRAFEAQRAAEQSRQFGATQGLTAAQTTAQYGQAAADAAERSRQFGSTLGLQGLQTATQAAQTQGQLGATQQQADIAGLKAISDLGATQRGIEAEDIAAQKAQFEEARLNPYKMVQFQQSLLSNLPLNAQTYNMAPTNNLEQFGSGLATLNELMKRLGIKP